MRILIADDDPINQKLLERFLTKWGYDIVLAQDGVEAWKILREPGAPKLAILDWMMPGMDGPEICREVRKQAENDYVYILMLTAKFQKTDIIAGLDSGADDYITKPFNPDELRARIRTGKRILDLQAQLRCACRRLKFEATHDSLTHLNNRQAILDILNRELERGRREQSPIGLIMVDVDYFQSVNDSYGHQVGDAVLREISKRLRASVRPYDAVGRYGGKEFLVVLPGCALTTALNRAEYLRDSIAKAPVETPGAVVSVTASIGVTVGGDFDEDTESMLRTVDAALYKAKREGRNQVAVIGGSHNSASVALDSL